jgi:membrane associated rhomboid family serine protease/Flp pilus assembly protein TadD
MFHNGMPGSSSIEATCPRCGAPFPPASEEHPWCPQCEQELSTPGSPSRGDRASHPPPGRWRFLLSPTLVLIGINVAVFVAMLLQGRALSFSPDLLLRWGANSGALTSGGQWWRLLSSIFVHGGPVHIALNMWCLFNLGWLAELLFGRWRFTLLYLLCGIGGSLASICWRGNGLSVGASGAIFGIAGALIPAMMLHSNPQARTALKKQLSSISVFVVYNLAFGAAVPGIDNAAHVGGLLTGFVLGAAYPTGSDRRRGRGQTGSPASRRWLAGAETGSPGSRRWLAGGEARALAGTLAVLIALAGAARFARAHNRGYFEGEQAAGAYQRGDMAAAMMHAQRAAALKPNDAHTQFLLGALYLEQKRYGDALAPLAATARLQPNFAPAYVNLCIAQLAIEQSQAALANCERGAKLAPNDADSWFNLGRARYAVHDLSGARNALAQSVAINPQGFDENLQYGLLLIASGDSAKASLYLQKAHNLRPDDEQLTRILQELAVTRQR